MAEVLDHETRDLRLETVQPRFGAVTMQRAGCKVMLSERITEPAHSTAVKKKIEISSLWTRQSSRSSIERNPSLTLGSSP